MGWFTYKIKLKCQNCGYQNELQVKKGITAEDFLNSNKCKCNECGVKIEADSYSTEWIK